MLIKHKILSKVIALWTAMVLMFSSVGPAAAQSGRPVMSSGMTAVAPLSPRLAGLQINPTEPFRLDFLFDLGGSERLSDLDQVMRFEAEETARYFMTVLTLPADAVWVNLSPKPNEQVMDEQLQGTRLGEAMLEADLRLKKAVARLLDPQEMTGERFWTVLHERGLHPSVSESIMKRIWVTAREADVAVEGQRVWITSCRLGLELRGEEASAAGILTDALVKEILFPILEKEINEAEEFAGLRRIFRATILAVWYKRYLMQTVLAHLFAQSGVRGGLESLTPQRQEMLLQEYLRSYGVGEFDRVRIEHDGQRALIRRYQAGGMDPARSVETALGKEGRRKSGGIIGRALSSLIIASLVLSPTSPHAAPPSAFSSPTIGSPSSDLHLINQSESQIPPEFDFRGVTVQDMNRLIDVLEEFFNELIQLIEAKPELAKRLKVSDSDNLSYLNDLNNLKHNIFLLKRESTDGIEIVNKIEEILERNDGLSAWLVHLYRLSLKKGYLFRSWTRARIGFEASKYTVSGDFDSNYFLFDMIAKNFSRFRKTMELPTVSSINESSIIEKAKVILFFEIYSHKILRNEMESLSDASVVAKHINDDFYNFIFSRSGLINHLIRNKHFNPYDRKMLARINKINEYLLKKYGLILRKDRFKVYDLKKDTIIKPDEDALRFIRELYDNDHEFVIQIREFDTALYFDNNESVLAQAIIDTQKKLIKSIINIYPDLVVADMTFPGFLPLTLAHEIVHIARNTLLKSNRPQAKIYETSVHPFKEAFEDYKFLPTDITKEYSDKLDNPQLLRVIYEEFHGNLAELIYLSGKFKNIDRTKNPAEYLKYANLIYLTYRFYFYAIEGFPKSPASHIPITLIALELMKELGMIKKTHRFTKKSLQDEIYELFLDKLLKEPYVVEKAARKVLERYFGEIRKITSPLDAALLKIPNRYNINPFRFPHNVWRPFKERLDREIGDELSDIIKKRGLAHYDPSNNQVVFFDQDPELSPYANNIWLAALRAVQSTIQEIQDVDALKRLILFHETLHVQLHQHIDLFEELFQTSRTWPETFWQAFEKTYGRPSSVHDDDEKRRWLLEEFIVLFGQEVYYRNGQARDWIHSWFQQEGGTTGVNETVDRIIGAIEEFYRSSTGQEVIMAANQAAQSFQPGGIDFKTMPLQVAGDVMEVPVLSEPLPPGLLIEGVEIKFIGWRWLAPPPLGPNH